MRAVLTSSGETQSQVRIQAAQRATERRAPAAVMRASWLGGRCGAGLCGESPSVCRWWKKEAMA